MRNQVKNKPTYKQIIDEVAQENFRVLMDKAQQFSHLAKVSHEQGRKIAYAGKNLLLKRLIELCDNVEVCRDYQSNDPKLLSVRYGMKRLHTKWQWLESIA